MPIVRIILPILGFISSLTVPAAILAQTTPVPSASSAPAAVASPLPTAHHHRHRPSFMHALRSLNLTPAQQQQVAAFHATEQQANAGANPATKQANAQKMRTQIMGILTPDQKTQLEAQLHPAGGSAPSPNPAPAH
jgi:Spy/CpxP family protein refolding chaperone